MDDIKPYAKLTPVEKLVVDFQMHIHTTRFPSMHPLSEEALLDDSCKISRIGALAREFGVDLNGELETQKKIIAQLSTQEIVEARKARVKAELEQSKGTGKNAAVKRKNLFLPASVSRPPSCLPVWR